MIENFKNFLKNYRVVFALIGVVCLLIGVLCFLMPPVSAEINNSASVVYQGESFVVVSAPTPTPAPTKSDTFFANTTLTSTTTKKDIPRIPANNNTRIEQGQCVEIGGVYDVSGVIGFTTNLDYNAFGWYGRYQDGYEPAYNNESIGATYTLKMPNNRVGYYQFLIDPIIFNDRQGYWYQYSGEFEKGANKRAFYVSDRCISSINNTKYVDVNNKPVILYPKVIDPRHVSDIVLSNDDPLFTNMTGEYQLWMFGYDDKILSREVNVTPTEPLLNVSEIKTFSIGSYNLLFQSSGANTVYELSYALNTRNTFDKDTLVPTFRGFDVLDITGFAPSVIQEKMEYFITKNTDDILTKFKMEVQEPYVEIDGYQEIQFDNTSLLEVAGYTNKMPGSFVTVFVDRDVATLAAIKYPSMTFTVENGSIGDYRIFHGYMPLYYENVAPGFHTLTAVLPNGKSSEVQFYIREEPEPHYQQPKYFKFVDGNPFIPEPTPIVVEKEVIKEVIKTVTVEKIVKEPVDYDTLANETRRKFIPVIVGILVIGIPFLYVCTLYIRAFAERRTRSKIEEKNL